MKMENFIVSPHQLTWRKKIILPARFLSYIYFVLFCGVLRQPATEGIALENGGRFTLTAKRFW